MIRDISYVCVWALVILHILIGLWDIYAIANGGPNESVSAAVYHIVREYPIIPFVIGLIAGHLFWPQTNGDK